jgi:prevent-host-death family protein
VKLLLDGSLASRSAEIAMKRQHHKENKIITATEVRRNFSAVVRKVRKNRGHAIIQSSGAPVAVLLSIPEYERLVAHSRRKTAFHDFAHHLGQEVEERGLSEEEFMADLEKTKRKVFTNQYGRPA